MEPTRIDEALSNKYEDIARRFLRSQSEQELYEASLLGRDLLGAGLGPTEVIQLHFTTTDRILKQHESGNRRGVINNLRELLLEVMMAHGEYHQEVRDVLAELEQRYAELDRTKRELENSRDELREKTAQLVQNEKMNALGELSASVAHEINQPLNAMKITCQDVLRDIQKGRLDVSGLGEDLRDTMREIDRVAEIVDHMRVFTRRTAGTRQEPLSIDEPLEGVFLLIGRQLALRGIDVTKELAADLQVIGDRVRLEQVFMNLIANARDAVANNNEPTPKTILVRTYLLPDDVEESMMKTVVVEISDNGCGIAHDLHEKIFEQFFTSKEIGVGTGLGLGIAQQIVAEHGGKIEVESEEGKGATFRVLLPLVAGGDP